MCYVRFLFVCTLFFDVRPFDDCLIPFSFIFSLNTYFDMAIYRYCMLISFLFSLFISLISVYIFIYIHFSSSLLLVMRYFLFSKYLFNRTIIYFSYFSYIVQYVTAFIMCYVLLLSINDISLISSSTWNLFYFLIVIVWFHGRSFF